MWHDRYYGTVLTPPSQRKEATINDIRSATPVSTSQDEHTAETTKGRKDSGEVFNFGTSSNFLVEEQLAVVLRLEVLALGIFAEYWK